MSLDEAREKYSKQDEEALDERVKGVVDTFMFLCNYENRVLKNAEFGLSVTAKSLDTLMKLPELQKCELKWLDLLSYLVKVQMRYYEAIAMNLDERSEYLSKITVTLDELMERTPKITEEEEKEIGSNPDTHVCIVTVRRNRDGNARA